MFLYLCAFLITVMFFLSGVQKVIKYPKVVNTLTFYRPLSHFMICVAILIELLAPPLVLYALFSQRSKLGIAACLSLAIFTVLATIMYHFPPVKSHYYPFVSNLSTLGGLLLLVYVFYNH